MRENDPSASSSAASTHEEAGSASELDFYLGVTGPPDYTPNGAATTQYGHTAWAGFGSSTAELTDLMHEHEHDSSDDHDMTDVDLEDGGVPLSATYSHDSDIISPFTGNTLDGTSYVGPSNSTDNLDDLTSLDNDEHSPPLVPFGPVSSNATLSSPPAMESIGLTPVVQMQVQVQLHVQAQAQAQAQTQAQVLTQAQTFAQLPAFAQQVLSNIPQQQLGQSQTQQQQAMLVVVQNQVINDFLEDDLGDLHGALPLSNPNHLTLGPDNFSLVDFLRSWARSGPSRDGHPAPPLEAPRTLIADKNTHRINYEQLKGDQCDFQGVSWSKLGVSRSKARDRRRATYKNYVNKAGSDKWHPSLPDRYAMPRDNYFRFKSMDIRRDTRLLHFQLRNILACTSRTRAFFPGSNAIRELDPTTGRTRKAMDFGHHSDVQVSTIAATDEILVAGSFLGDYRYRNINSEDRDFTEGKLTEHISGITNHVQIHSARRSSAPIAAFASNDFGFRTVDLTTNQLLFESMYNYPLNCSAISTDQRLRVMVGDHTNVLITDAETGEILQDLSGHRDFGFACDWAPDGWTVATGFQDKSVRIWDARRWTNNHNGEGAPIAVLRCDMSGARSLRFSPLGSGKRLLVAAEEADIVSIFDAQTFDTQQKIDMFGEIGGTAFADDGEVLMALNTDPARGGIVQFERCDGGTEDAFNTNDWDLSRRSGPPRTSYRYDWGATTKDTLGLSQSLETLTERRRKAVASSNLEPF